MAVDLTTMNKKQLEKLLKDVQAELKIVAVRERREAKKAAEKAAAKFGFSLSELTGGASARGRKKGGVSPSGDPKYVNPSDPDQTWTGKGRQPRWFKDAVAAGTDPSTMEL
ncbi:H-NS histone family protein [Aliishimia ponticola]|uniref:H-NS histone family protein n=1 Tax=Aliishimia ponticola TaxID=2499833 RepID=A0A4V3XK93_9RHOB|nr:H-NS histone family protein [Aliishimia ponticola]THH36013.1 H-NS histone family protein [Aliishimia ponticola]